MQPDPQPDQVTPRTLGLKAYIAEAARSLINQHQPDGEDDNRLLFFGNWQDAHPRALLYDPALTSDDKMAWLIMKASADPKAPTSMPDYDHFMRAGLGSRPTVAKCKTMLRITRWISLCHRVRDGKGRFRGNVYALHDEPIPLMDALYLDEGYIDFLRECQNHRSGQVRDTASAVLDTIRERLEAGEDVTRDGAFHLRAAGRVSALRGERSAFFSLSRKPGNQVKQVNAADRVNEVNPAENDRVNDVNLDPKSLIHGRVNELNSGSSSYIKTTTTNNSSRTPRATKPQPSDAVSDTPLPPELHWPDAMSQSERRLAMAVLGELPTDAAQQILDELAGAGDGVQDRLRWLAAVTRRWHDGNFAQSSRGLGVSEARQRADQIRKRQEQHERAIRERLDEHTRELGEQPLPPGRLGKSIGRLLERVQQANHGNKAEAREQPRKSQRHLAGDFQSEPGA